MNQLVASKMINFDIKPLIISAFVAITVLSGDFSIGRVIPGLSRSFGEVRILGTLILILIALFLHKEFKLKVKESVWTLIPLGVLCIVIVIKCVPCISSEKGLSYFVDSAILLLNAIIIYALINDVKSANCFLLLAIGLSMVIFCFNSFNIFFHAINVQHHFFIGTSFTFNRLLLFGSISALVYFFSKKQRDRKKLIFAIIALLYLFGALISMSKAAFLSGLCAALWLSVWTAVKGQYKRMLLIVLSISIVYGLFFSLSTIRINLWLHDLDSSITEAPIKSKQNQTLLNMDKSDRIPMIIEAIRIIRKNPIWGAGPNAFKIEKPITYRKDETPYYSYPHNVVLEVFVLGGVLTGSVFLLSVLGPFVPALREILYNDQVLALSTSMIIFFVESMVGGDLYDFRLFWYAAILIPVYKKEHNEKSNI